MAMWVTGIWGEDTDEYTAFVARGLALIGAAFYDHCSEARDRVENEEPEWV